MSDANNYTTHTTYESIRRHSEDASEGSDASDVGDVDDLQEDLIVHSEESTAVDAAGVGPAGPSGPTLQQRRHLTFIERLFPRMAERVLPKMIYRRLSPYEEVASTSGAATLFEADENADPSAHTFPPVASGSRRNIVGGGERNDGVFANLSAKPETYDHSLDVIGDNGNTKETLPSYESAVLDSVPAYRENFTPISYAVDDILVDGLPLGNFFAFAWNLIVSMSFQFVGFMLTFLLHTTHAAKNGSRVGLGITLIQLGLYMKQRDGLADPDATPVDKDLASSEADSWDWFTSRPGDSDMSSSLFGASSMNGFNGTMNHPVVTSEALDDANSVFDMTPVTSGYVSVAVMSLGALVILFSMASYYRALKQARQIRLAMAQASSVDDSEIRIVID